MLGVTGGRRPPSTWLLPSRRFPERLEAAWGQVSERSIALAGGDPLRVTRDAFLTAFLDTMQGLTDKEVDYVRQVTLVVIQQMRGSNLFFGDLDYLKVSLLQGRVPPAELDPQPASLTASLFSTCTATRGTKTLDLLKTTGVNWKVPAGFLSRYTAASSEVLRRAASLVGARHDGSKEVVEGLWGRVDVATFVEACRQVLPGGLSAEEEEYVAAVAAEQVVPTPGAFIRDLPFLDKCLLQGRTPTAIKGPQLLPTIFLNNTTTSPLGGDTAASLRATGGRTY
ncbi:hypothetical protein Agub_g7526 [Astrephomene gubernaculifera]|uniref:Uncharacterized protein n=1 Tax=Astrephomene gubernaculifera TaxID=47775 RepID=A0AAD3HMI2_9CHLO|nr:hypothetical protein Agub_g7526 [Astrephomene gubernaculifera]